MSLSLFDELPSLSELEEIRSKKEVLRKRIIGEMGAAMIGSKCRGLGDWWIAIEAAHAQAKKPSEAAAAAAPAVARCWSGCPVVRQCAIRAAADRYDGIAAGQAWKSGRPKPTTVLSRPGRPPKALAVEREAV